jgi:hypothetical protein
VIGRFHLFCGPIVTEIYLGHASSCPATEGGIAPADFDTWTKGYSDQYFQICLAYGLWPSFFSADAADHVYFTNSSLIERDRPIWRQFIPVLRAINLAGWEPLTLANTSRSAVSGTGGGDDFILERFGSLQRGTRLFFTLRHLNATTAALSSEVTLTLHVAELGLTDKHHAMVEVAQRGRVNVTVSPLVVRHGAKTVDVQVSGLSHESTLVLEVLQ